MTSVGVPFGCLACLQTTQLLLLQKRSGDEGVKALKASEGLQLSKLLEGDLEFDSSLQSPKDFLVSQGLQCLAD